MAERKIIGYWIENTESTKSDLEKQFGRVRAHHWPEWDGPIEGYIEQPERYIVTPIYEE